MGCKTLETLINRAFIEVAELFPLNCSGWFRGYIIDHSIDMSALVCDAVADFGKNIIRNSCPVGSHKVIGCNGSDDNHIVICSVVTHNAYGVDARKNAEELRKVALVTVLLISSRSTQSASCKILTFSAVTSPIILTPRPGPGNG